LPSSSPAAEPSTAGIRLAAGYALRQDPDGFRLAVPTDWRRQRDAPSRQIRYAKGDFTLIVVPGRDAAQPGDDPLDYQRAEAELAAFRADLAGQASSVRRVDVGRRSMADGSYRWSDSHGRRICAQNQVVIIGGRYHVILVMGPRAQCDRVAGVFEQATTSYQPNL
jgi:hypothetical protein